MLTILLTLATATAADGFYHPGDVAAASTRFAEAQGQLLAPLEARQATARQLSTALRSYREGLDALGTAAPADQVARLEALEQTYLRRFEALQQFADGLVGDFDDAFTAALDRATGGADLQVCAAEIAVGPKVPGMGGRTQANPACQGEARNTALAAAIDADPALAEALPGILGRPWPELALDVAPQPPVGAGERHVHLQALLEAGAGKALRTIDRDDDDARMAIEAELEDGADADELRALTATGEGIAAQTAARRAALAAPIVEAADKALAKWGAKEGATAWCVQPAPLGGCSGTDATAELVPRLVADKKVAKALP